ncbi:molybdate ABC transporter substrate-binding protein [Oceanobacillus halophilus]|uniref:Molybdate ABC transporter substrate-binding protein n=1 Tax=Oceanobacillus halophilus TaxID=930130 RepID=A0A495AE66_9BACI|nr:molybdate ABC transporter substrate-binding protein [Oceanobacillus halophilus]RKQ37245.1 molybdate ABC transporter substrate-binding protein [Oceanobacillus halophilus]
MKRFRLILLILFLLTSSGCASSSESSNTIKLTVSAASSMTESLLELKDAFEKENPSIEISYNFGGSGALRKQIEQGAPIDLFFSASSDDYNKLVKHEMVHVGTAIFENKLVLIKSEQAKFNSIGKFLQQDGMMAIGTPESVPAGNYAKEALENLEAWEKLKDRVVFTKDVSQVLTLVSQGAVEAGIVYSSDLMHSNNIFLVEEFTRELHSSIEYFAAVIKNREQNDEVFKAREKFYQFILEDTAMEIFEHYGFQMEK